MTKPVAVGKRSETGDFTAEDRDEGFSFLQRKHTTSTMQIFPTHRHRHSSPIPAEWSHLHTLIKLSSDVFSADKASPTVAETERDLRAGFPRQRSDTSCASKPKAMQKKERLVGALRTPAAAVAVVVVVVVMPRWR